MLMDLSRVQAILKERNLDALIASSSENIFYTSGLDSLPTSHNTILFMLRRIGPAFVLVPREGEPRLIVSYGTSMYLEKLKEHPRIGFTPTGMHLELPQGEAMPDMYESGAMKGLVQSHRREQLEQRRHRHRDGRPPGDAHRYAPERVAGRNIRRRPGGHHRHEDGEDAEGDRADARGQSQDLRSDQGHVPRD